MNNAVFGAGGTGRKRWLLFLARSALLWERLGACFWRPFLLVGLFLSAVFLDLLPRLPGALHLAVLLAFAAAFAFLIRAGAREFAWPLARDARRRIEKDSGLRHRPLTVLRDHQVGGRRDPVSRALWRAHLKRVLAATGRLRVSGPVSGLAGKDPFAIRAAVLLIFVIALVAGRGDAAARMERALLPYFGPGGDGPVTVQIWITPPAYTGLPPLFLTSPRQRQGNGGVKQISAAAPIRVAAGSMLLAQTGDAGATPRLNLGGRAVSFVPIGADPSGGGYRAQAAIGAIGRNGRTGARTIAVELGRRTLAQWPILVVADRPPEAAFASPPEPVGRSRLRFDYRAWDDYGVTSITAIIKRTSGGPDAARKPEARLSLPLPLPPRAPVSRAQGDLAPGMKADGGRGVSLRTQSVRDLSAHPWAGLPVTVTLEARDGAGQTGTSDPVVIVLPERTFRHPVARAIIAERKKLAGPGGGDRDRVAMALGVIAAGPERFNNDMVVSVVLAVARARLLYDISEKSIRSIRALLWDTALRIEDGGLGAAERELARAEEDMMKALGNGGKGSKLEEKIDALGRALDRYLGALARDLARRGVPPGVIGANAGILMNEDLKRMLDQAREMARTGALDGLRGIMDTLRRFLDAVRSAAKPGSGSGDLAKIMRLMDGLNRLTEDQKTLLDETFRRAEKARSEKRSERKAGKDITLERDAARSSARQEALRRRLGGIMPGLDEIMGKIPRDFGRADRAMRNAVRALARSSGGDAVESQTRALESLRRAAAEVSGNMARRMDGRIGIGGGGLMMPGRRGRDPFGRIPGGRMPGGGMATNKVKIPSRIDAREARRILRELRNRSGQYRRPRRERDYIERLLKQW